MISFTPSQWAGFGADGIELGFRATKNLVKSHPKAIGTGLLGMDLAITAGTSKKGEFATDMAGSVAGNIGALAGNTIGTMLGGPVGGIVGGIAGDYVARSTITKGLRMAREVGQLSKANLGGRYVDTSVAYTMRQKSAQELGGSLLNARRYLGSEGAMFH